jgi:hypothetical protein
MHFSPASGKGVEQTLHKNPHRSIFPITAFFDETESDALGAFYFHITGSRLPLSISCEALSGLSVPPNWIT